MRSPTLYGERVYFQTGGLAFMAKKKKVEPVEIHQPVVEMVPLNLLELNPENPKKPMTKDKLKGLNSSLTEFGLRDMIKVAPHPEIEGAYLVLDGNTRIEELRKRTDENVEIPCLVHTDLTTREKVMEFVLTFDRNTKDYDSMAVLEQLKELVDSGENIKMLAELTNIPDLQKYIDDMDASDPEMQPESIDTSLFVEQDSILISGPKSDIDGIKTLLRGIKGKMERNEQVSKALQNIKEFDWSGDDGSDETLLFIVLAIAAHLMNSANKIIIPCVSFDQKMMMLGKAKELIEQEHLEGGFALGRAFELMLADFEITTFGRESK
jgi:mannitol/fructose-specific phosphotransferase system IIA component (Ntr-type)